MIKSPKLNVGLVFDDSLDSTDGVAQYVKTLGSWLSSQGHRVSYLVGETKLQEWAGGKVIPLSKNLRVKWGGNRLSISLIPNNKLIKRTLKQNDFDVLHVQVPYSPFMSQLVINRSAPKTAVVGTVHVFPANQLAIIGTKILRFIYGRSFKRFNQIVSVSTAAQGFSKQALGVNTKIVPNTVDLKNFKTHGINIEKNKIVFLGRLVKRKGCQQLLEAFNILYKSTPEARLVIAGDGPLRQTLQTYVTRHKLDSAIEFKGFVSEEEKVKLLASAQIACFPSLYGESFGIVLIEAMAAGSQVVLGGHNPGYASVLGNRIELLFDPNNAEQFAQKIKDFLSDKSKREAAYKWQQAEVKKYDINVVGAQIIKIYLEAIARLGKNGHNKVHG